MKNPERMNIAFRAGTGGLHPAKIIHSTMKLLVRLATILPSFAVGLAMFATTGCTSFKLWRALSAVSERAVRRFGGEQ